MTSVVNVNSHFRPRRLTSRVRSSSDFPRVKINVCPPWTNIRKTNNAPRRETISHQYCCRLNRDNDSNMVSSICYDIKKLSGKTFSDLLYNNADLGNQQGREENSKQPEGQLNR